MNPTRRTFLTTGLATLFAAPAIVRASSLMAVRALPRPLFLWGDVTTTIMQYGIDPVTGKWAETAQTVSRLPEITVGENGSMWTIKLGPAIGTPANARYDVEVLTGQLHVEMGKDGMCVATEPERLWPPNIQEPAR